MMSVLVENPEGKAILLTKGAPEEVFQQCSQFELDGKLSPMDPDLMRGLRDEYESLSNDGFRVLAVATKELPAKQALLKRGRARPRPERVCCISGSAQRQRRHTPSRHCISTV